MGKAVCQCLAENGYFVYSLDIKKYDNYNAIEVSRVADKIMEVWNEYGPAEVKV
mgnify:CR=1 FL=1